MANLVALIIFALLILVAGPWLKRQSRKSVVFGFLFAVVVYFVSLFTFLGPIISKLDRTVFVSDLIYNLIGYLIIFVIYLLGIVLYNKFLAKIIK